MRRLRGGGDFSPRAGEAGARVAGDGGGGEGRRGRADPVSMDVLGSMMCDGLPLTYKGKGLPPWLGGKESSCNTGATGDMSSIPGSGRSPRGGHGNPLQHSCLENPVDRGAWRAQSIESQRVGLDRSALARTRKRANPDPHTVSVAQTQAPLRRGPLPRGCPGGWAVFPAEAPSGRVCL